MCKQLEMRIARLLRLAVVQQQYNNGNLSIDEAKIILSGRLNPDDSSTIIDDSRHLVIGSTGDGADEGGSV